MESEHPILKEFALFPNLPLEIQCQIWRTSIVHDNLVEFEYDHLRRRILAQRSVTVVLRVCRESRKETIRGGCRLAFGTKKTSSLPGGRPPQIWFNFEFETASTDLYRNQIKRKQDITTNGPFVREPVERLHVNRLVSRSLPV